MTVRGTPARTTRGTPAPRKREKTRAAGRAEIEQSAVPRGTVETFKIAILDARPRGLGGAELFDFGAVSHG